jgi:hypothetical protein
MTSCHVEQLRYSTVQTSKPNICTHFTFFRVQGLRHLTRSECRFSATFPHLTSTACSTTEQFAGVVPQQTFRERGLDPSSTLQRGAWHSNLEVGDQSLFPGMWKRRLSLNFKSDIPPSQSLINPQAADLGGRTHCENRALPMPRACVVAWNLLMST